MSWLHLVRLPKHESDLGWMGERLMDGTAFEDLLETGSHFRIQFARKIYMGCHRPDAMRLLGIVPFHGDFKSGSSNIVPLAETHRKITDASPERAHKHLLRRDPLILPAFLQRLVHHDPMFPHLHRQLHPFHPRN